MGLFSKPRNGKRALFRSHVDFVAVDSRKFQADEECVVRLIEIEMRTPLRRRLGMEDFRGLQFTHHLPDVVRELIEIAAPALAGSRQENTPHKGSSALHPVDQTLLAYDWQRQKGRRRAL